MFRNLLCLFAIAMACYILTLGAVASASAFVQAPVPIRTGMPSATCAPPLSPISLMDEREVLLSTLSGLAALGLHKIQNQPGQPWAAQLRTATHALDYRALARDNFQVWNEALQTKDPKAVADLYSTSDLSFLPTVSPEHIKQTEGTEGYFIAFVQKNPFGTITDDNVQVFNNGDAYLHSGMYTFELGEENARAPVQARFSYVWQRIGGRWKITHHHSSLRPAAPDMVAIARTNFQAWNDALQTKDPKAVANFYSEEELSFLPTVSSRHVNNLGGTEEYFAEFVKKNPFGTITDDSVTMFDDGDAYLHSGMYTFEIGEKGARSPVEARFSYVWRKIDSAWKITHHHSSVRPPSPAPTSAPEVAAE